MDYDVKIYEVIILVLNDRGKYVSLLKAPREGNYLS